MHLMLDPHLRPATPDANSAISQRIYNEHKQMAQEYLKVQTEIAYTSRHKEQLLAKMTPEQRKERLEICSYLKDTVSFFFCFVFLKCSFLSRQLSKVCHIQQNFRRVSQTRL